MRVNIEDDLWTSGRISKLSRVMRWSEREALGALALVYRATQKAGIVSDTPSRIQTVCVIHFDSDEETDKFLTAMVSAHLASILADGKMHIRGNEKHIERLDRLLGSASKAGTKSAALRQKKLNDSQTEGQPTGNHNPTYRQPTGNLQATLLTPYSLLLTPNTEENTNTENSKVPKQKRKPRTPSAPAAEAPGFSDVIACWFEHYERKYRKKPVWGPRQGAQLKQLLTSYKAADLIHPETGLIRYFFAWQRPEVILGGHSFGKGHSCFILKIEELEADMSSPERRNEAAIARKRQNLTDSIAEDKDASNRITELLNQGDPFDGFGRMAESTSRGMVESYPSGARQLAPGSETTARVTQQEVVGSRGDGLVQSASTLREGKTNMESAGGGMRVQNDSRNT